MDTNNDVENIIEIHCTVDTYKYNELKHIINEHLEKKDFDINEMETIVKKLLKIKHQKKCKGCGVVKELTMFANKRRECKDCRRLIQQKYYQKNKTKWHKYNGTKKYDNISDDKKS